MAEGISNPGSIADTFPVDKSSSIAADLAPTKEISLPDGDHCADPPSAIFSEEPLFTSNVLIVPRYENSSFLPVGDQSNDGPPYRHRVVMPSGIIGTEREDPD